MSLLLPYHTWSVDTHLPGPFCLEGSLGPTSWPLPWWGGRPGSSRCSPPPPADQSQTTRAPTQFENIFSIFRYFNNILNVKKKQIKIWYFYLAHFHHDPMLYEDSSNGISHIMSGSFFSNLKVFFGRNEEGYDYECSEIWRSLSLGWQPSQKCVV